LRLPELVEEPNFHGRGPAGSIFFGYRFVAHGQEPALPYISPPETQVTLDAIVQNFFDVKIESRGESIRSASLGVARRDARVPACSDLEFLKGYATFGH